MGNQITKKLAEFISRGAIISSVNDGKRWCGRVSTFLQHTFGDEIKKEFDKFDSESFTGFAAAIGYLEALEAKLMTQEVLNEDREIDVSSLMSENKSHHVSFRKNDKKVFVVHGHDHAVKEATARYLEKIGLSPIILHEQPNLGRTVIEKFEIFSDVGFAIVLLTPDDKCISTDNDGQTSKRARQNVVLELGYFIGKLGRERVCALYVEGVEMPSDYQGVLYIKYDSEGGWKTKLAQELIQCGMKIDLSGLI